MTAPAQVPPPADSSNADEVIAALGALLLAGVAAAAVIKLLGTLKGLSSSLVSTVFTQRKMVKLLTKKVTKPGQNAAAKARIRYLADEQAASARSAYLVNAMLRLVPAHATKDAGVIAAANAREDSYAVAHAGAVAHREAAAAALLKVVGKSTPDGDGRILLGWYGDDHPCPVCLLADGCNFDALAPPLIGWPGAVHPHCYCTAGAPHDTDLMVDDVVTQRSQGGSVEQRASNLKHGKGSKLWKYWTGSEGFARYAGSDTPWETLRNALLSEGVPPGQADGLATNIMMATPAGKALYAKGHKTSSKKRSVMTIETRAAKVTEIRGPGTAKPDEKPGFTARMVAYGVPDSYRTSWQKGVFTRALEQRQGDGHSIPVVWDHNWADPVGQVVAYRDEQDGFYADVEFDDLEAVPRAKQAHAQIKSGTMGQFSFAFARGEETEDTEHRGVMRQTSVEAVQEFSIVLNGSVPGTGVMATRSGRVDARKAADLIERFGRGEVDLTDALVELRSVANTTPAPTHEFRALPGMNIGEPADPGAVLTAVDEALAGVADQLDKADVEAARRFFSQAASRLSELQYLLGMTPSVDGYGESYAWRALEQGEVRTEEKSRDQAPEPFPELAAPRGYRTMAHGIGRRR